MGYKREVAFALLNVKYLLKYVLCLKHKRFHVADLSMEFRRLENDSGLMLTYKFKFQKIVIPLTDRKESINPI